MQSIYDRPKTRQPCPTHKIAPRNSKQTLRELLTDNETKNWRLSLLKEMSARPKGPWKEFHSFFIANQSGDVESFKPEGKALIAKMITALDKEYEKRMTGEEDAVEKEQVKESVQGKRQS